MIGLKKNKDGQLITYTFAFTETVGKIATHPNAQYMVSYDIYMERKDAVYVYLKPVEIPRGIYGRLGEHFDKDNVIIVDNKTIELKSSFSDNSQFVVVKYPVVFIDMEKAFDFYLQYKPEALLELLYGAWHIHYFEWSTVAERQRFYGQYGILWSEDWRDKYTNKIAEMKQKWLDYCSSF